MKTKIEKINGCSRTLVIEVSTEELTEEFNRVYTDIGQVANVPGFRPGRVPRDLLETHYSKKAEEEVVKRAIPEYYLRAVEEESLAPVAPPEIDNVQFENHTLYFRVRVDVRPQLKLKSYKNLLIKKKKVEITSTQIDAALERLRQSRAKYPKNAKDKEKEKILPQLDDVFAQEIGFSSLKELKDVLGNNLTATAQLEIRQDMERQITEELLKIASIECVPQSLINNQMQELINQIKLNRILQGEKKEEVEQKEKEIEESARKEAIRRVKLSFILDEIMQRENIQVNEQELEERIAQMASRISKDKEELRKYLEQQNLIPGLKHELSDKKTINFLISCAKVQEEV